MADQLGGLSILVNNAGIQHSCSFATTEARRVASDAAPEIQTNLTSVIALTADCLPLLRTAAAAIVSVSSGLALAPKAAAPVYCATKAAIHTFSRSLRHPPGGSVRDPRRA